MPAATLNLDGDRIIEQGSYWRMELLYPGDITGAYLRGEIRKTYGGEPVAQIQAPPPEYLIPINATRFVLFLYSQVTADIPLPPIDGYWVYDLLLQLPGEDVRRLVQGKVYVSPGVTGV